MKCPRCGANLPAGATSCGSCGVRFVQRQQISAQPAARPPQTVAKQFAPQSGAKSGSLKVWKLVSGILSIVLSMLVLFQSCAAGLVNTISDNGEVSGSAGLVVAILLLSGGIVSIAVRNMTKKGGNIAIIVLYGIAALVGYILAGNYKDLYIWSTWCLICAILGILAMIRNNASSPAPAAVQKPAVKKPAPTGAFRWWQIPVALALFLLGFGMGFAVNGGTPTAKPKEPAKKPSQASSSIKQSKVSSEPQEASEAPVNAQPISPESGLLGDYEVSILEARTASDYEGKPAIIVGYQFTNHSDENQKFMVAVHGKAFQNGVQLESAILAGSDENYKGDNYLKDVQPGATLEVEQAYRLQDEISEVTVEVSELISFSKDKLTKKFSLS